MLRRRVFIPFFLSRMGRNTTATTGRGIDIVIVSLVYIGVRILHSGLNESYRFIFGAQKPTSEITLSSEERGGGKILTVSLRPGFSFCFFPGPKGEFRLFLILISAAAFFGSRISLRHPSCKCTCRCRDSWRRIGPCAVPRA